jgi:hypothetical protein
MPIVNPFSAESVSVTQDFYVNSSVIAQFVPAMLRW